MEFPRALFAHIKAHTKRDILVLAGCLLLIIGSGFFFWFSSLSIPDVSLFQQRQVAQSTKIYDRTGSVLLYDVSGSARRTVVAAGDISDNLKNATVAIEDSGFYTHGGIRILSIIRAMFADLFSGGFSQGGSTITQQVIKNTLLTNDKTLARKIKEWILAIKLERIFSKNDILTLYLNDVPYGGNIYGVEEASEAFFGKAAKDVDVAESAYLASIPQAPTYYSPYGANKAALDARENLTLQKMKDSGFITDAQYQQAINEKVIFLPSTSQTIKAPHFVMYVIQYLEQKYGVDAVENGGLNVVTTLDYPLQAESEAAVESYINNQGPNFNMSNAASVAIDPKTGDILSMVGSYDYFSTTTEGNFNVATAANRQPGSTFKPIIYSEAFIKGYTPETVLFDEPTEFDSSCSPEGKPLSPSTNQTECYMPQDFDGLYRGPMSLRDALAQSINIPSIQLSYLAGLGDSLKLAQRMGITSLSADPNQYGLTLVLGGGGVSLLEMTDAYGVFANDGSYVPYRSILKVTDGTGNILEQANPPIPISVMPANVARTISDILSDDQARAAEYGLHSVFDIPGYSVAAKTGTTNNTKDVWTIGYSPDVVVGVWGGNDDDTAMVKKIAGLIIAPLWHTLMADALASTSADTLIKPTTQDISSEKPIFRGIWQGGQTYTIDTISGKLATEYTPPETQKEIAVTNVHSILYWVDKNDPLGPAPVDPTKDSQFNNWEKPALDWAAANGYENGATTSIPTQFDDVHVAANMPSVNVSDANNGNAYSENGTATINIRASGKYPIQKISIYGNDGIIATLTGNQSTYRFPIKNIYSLSSTNIIKVEVVDAVFDRASATTQIKVSGI
jgi:penicillin-binding protein 1C